MYYWHISLERRKIANKHSTISVETWHSYCRLNPCNSEISPLSFMGMSGTLHWNNLEMTWHDYSNQYVLGCNARASKKVCLKFRDTLFHEPAAHPWPFHTGNWWWVSMGNTGKISVRFPLRSCRWIWNQWQGWSNMNTHMAVHKPRWNFGSGRALCETYTDLGRFWRTSSWLMEQTNGHETIVVDPDIHKDQTRSFGIRAKEMAMDTTRRPTTAVVAPMTCDFRLPWA